LSCPLIVFVAVIILLRFAHVIFIEVNVDKIINALKNFFCKRCKRLSHLCTQLAIFGCSRVP